MARLLFTFLLSTLISNQMLAQQNIFDAARNGDLALARELFNVNKDTINCQNAQGYTPLILACYYDRIDFISFLISNKVALNEVQNSPTALQAAAYKGFTDAVKLLLKYGANPNIFDANGTSPLIYATQFGHTEIVKELLKKGASVSYKDPNGLDAIDYAEKLRQIDILNLLKASN